MEYQNFEKYLKQNKNPNPFMSVGTWVWYDKILEKYINDFYTKDEKKNFIENLEKFFTKKKVLEDRDNFLDYSKNYKFMTNPYRNTGMGEVFKILFFTIYISESYNIPFKYTMHTFTDHNYNDNFIERFWSNTNLKILFEHNTDLKIQRQWWIADDNGYIDNCTTKNISNLDNSTLINKYRKIFRYNKKFSCNNDCFNIAIHIRRSNSFDTRNGINSNELLTFVLSLYPDEFYINLIKHFYENYSKIHKNIKIHIYSQDLNKNIYDMDYIVFHLDEDPINSFNDMVLSDVLVTGASNFSYSAALLRNKSQKTYYLEYLNFPLNSWIKILSEVPKNISKYRELVSDRGKYFK